MILWHQRTTDPTRPYQASSDIYIVEFKNCRDSEPQSASAVAAAQHEDLRQQMVRRHPHARIRTVVILIGMAGTIYQDFTITPLQQLGVQGNELEITLKKVVICTVKQLHKVWRHRWALIKQGNQKTRAGIG
jgi:hypothetical protein